MDNMFSLVQIVWTTISTWWGSLSWTTRINLIFIIIIAAIIGVQYQIIRSNKTKIDNLQSEISQLQLDAKLKDLESQISIVKTQIDANKQEINAYQAKIDALRAKIYNNSYKPDPNMKASQIADGFRALSNETP